MYIPFIERPVVQIKTATGGCGYASMSWSVIGNVDDDDMCGIGSFNITLTSMDMSMTVITRSLSYNFTGLPDDTVFNVTVIGISVIGNSFISFDFASLKTLVIESMFVCTYMHIACMCMYMHIYTYIVHANYVRTYCTHMHTTQLLHVTYVCSIYYVTGL